EEVGAAAPGRVVCGGGEQELAGCVEGVGMPPGVEHPLPKDEIDVLALPDAEAHPDVHLRPDGTLAHGLLRGALSGRYEGDGDCASSSCDRVRVAGGVGCVVGEFGVLVYDDDERGEFWGRIPYAPSVGCEPFGARLQDGDGVAQHGLG